MIFNQSPNKKCMTWMSSLCKHWPISCDMSGLMADVHLAAANILVCPVWQRLGDKKRQEGKESMQMAAYSWGL